MSTHKVEVEYNCHSDCGPSHAPKCTGHKSVLIYHGSSHLYEVDIPFALGEEKLLVEPGALEALVKLYKRINDD